MTDKRRQKLIRRCCVAAEFIRAACKHVEQVATMLDNEEMRCEKQDEQFPYVCSGTTVQAWANSMRIFAGGLDAVEINAIKESNT